MDPVRDQWTQTIQYQLTKPGSFEARKAGSADLKCTLLKLLVHISPEVLFKAVAEKPAKKQTLRQLLLLDRRSQTGRPCCSVASTPVKRQGMPVNMQGMPVDWQGMPVKSRGMPVNRQGMPVNRQGMPVNRQGMPVNRQGCQSIGRASQSLHAGQPGNE